MGLLAVTASAFAQDSELYKCEFSAQNNQTTISAYDKTWEVISSGTTWSVVNFNNNNNGMKDGQPSENSSGGANVWTFVRCGRKTNASYATLTNKEAFPEAISSVVVDLTRFKAGTNDELTAAYLIVKPELTTTCDSTVYNIDVTAFNSASAATNLSPITVEIENPAANMFYVLALDCKSGAKDNGFCQLNSVTYYGIAEGPAKQDPNISFSVEEVSAVLGENFVQPALSCDSDGAVSYSSSNEDVATIDAESGIVTLVGGGKTVITAKVAATDTHKAGSATYLLTVTDPNIIFSSALGEGFDFVQVSGDQQPWSLDSRYGLKASGYINSANVALVGIASSPLVDLTNYKDIVLNFEAAYNQFKSDGTLIADTSELTSFCEFAVKGEDDADWTVIDYQLTFPSTQSWTFSPNEAPISLDAYKGHKIQFGYKYTSTDDTAGTWEIKNIVLSGKMVSGIQEIENEGEAIYFNLQGLRVDQPTHGIFIKVSNGKSSKIIF